MVLLDIDVEIPEDTPVDVEINLPILDDEPINQSLRRKHSYYWTTGHVHFDVEKKVHLKVFVEKAESGYSAYMNDSPLDYGCMVRASQWRPPLKIFVLHTRK